MITKYNPLVQYIYMLYTCGETLFTYHIYDLHEADAQLNCETVRVIDDWSLQWVVATHQVLVQSTLVCPLKRNYGRQRNLDSEYTSFRKKNRKIVTSFPNSFPI